MQRILVHIPARGGSKGLPGKNLRPVLGVSLVGWAVLTGRRLRAGTRDRAELRVMVDSDDEATAAEAARWGAEVPYRRPADLAADDTPTAPVVLHALSWYEAQGWSPDAVVLLQPTSPLRTVEDAAACLGPYLSGMAESVVSVTSTEHPFELGMTLLSAGSSRTVQLGQSAVIRRQDAIPRYFPSGAVYVIASPLLRSSGRFLHDGSTQAVELPRQRSLDIDSEGHLMLAGSIARGDAIRDGGEAVVSPDDRATGWPRVSLRDLSTTLAAPEVIEGNPYPGGLVITEFAGLDPVRIFDGIAACRRATGLPVAFPSEAPPEHAAAARLAGATMVDTRPVAR